MTGSLTSTYKHSMRYCFLSSLIMTGVSANQIWRLEVTSFENCRAKVAAASLIAKVPAPGEDYRDSRRVGNNSNYITYATDGFARGTFP